MNRLTTSLLLLAVAIYGRAIGPQADEDEYPKYAYKYAVRDPITKDNKEHWETRDGDAVKGAYWLQEPDGKKRVVEYWADDTNGFNAIVKRLGINALPPKLRLPPVTQAPLKGLIPRRYGFGAATEPASVEPTTGAVKEIKPTSSINSTSIGRSHLPWDPKTGSFGGWVPLKRKEPFALIYSKKHINGIVHHHVAGPISLVGKVLVIKHKH